MADDLTIRLQAQNGAWETCGVDRFPTVKPNSLVASANQWGSDTSSFQLARRPGDYYPDLAAWTPCEIEVGGVPVWTGRVWETPAQEGKGRNITVQGRGWQYHLDDDAYQFVYIASKLGDWRDWRSFVQVSVADIGRVGTAAGQVTTDNIGITTIGWPKGAQVNAGGPAVGITLDLGPASTCASVAIDYDVPSRTGAAGIFGLYIRSGASGDPLAPGTFIDYAASTDITALTAGGATIAASGAGQRYVHIFLSYLSTGGTIGEDNMVRIKGARIATNASYISGGVSALHADTAIKDAITRAPLLSTDTSQVTAVSFAIPDLEITSSQTPRQVIQAVNAYHNYMTMVDLNRRLVFGPQPSVANYEVGEWSGAQFQDASTNSAEDVYNRVIVEGTDPSGNPIYSKIAVSPDTTVVGLRGFTRSKVLPVNAAITNAEAAQIGNAFLNQYKLQPLKGTLVALPGGIREASTGRKVHPSELLKQSNQLVRLLNRVDPNTGGVGRDGRMVSVEYTHATRSAAISLDNTRQNFEALLSRLEVIQSSR